MKAWSSKVSDAFNAGSGDACTDPSTAACASYVRHLMSVTDELRDALESGDGAKRYPQMVSLIGKMDDAYVDFQGQTCTSVEGSPCFVDVTAIMSDGSDLGNALVGGGR